MIFDALPKSLLIAAVVQASCQVFKFVTASVRARSWRWSALTSFGGMPSAHSAFVTSTAVAIGLFEGFSSNLFALSVVLGAIVILDALKLRGAVQNQAIVLNRIQNQVLPEGERRPLSESVGHTLPEIGAGIALALAVATPLAWFWR